MGCCYKLKPQFAGFSLFCFKKSRPERGGLINKVG
jgi:hypothetical protein